MASLKTNVKANSRGVLNTTINKNILDDFKRTCKTSGVAMNTLIEAFMRQYNEGNFYLKFGSTEKDVSNYNNNVKDNFAEII